MRHIHILTAPEIHSTGHYIAAAARAARCCVSVDTKGIAPPALDAGDLLLYVDPGPRSFPIGIDQVRSIRVAYFIDVHQDVQSRLDLAPLFDLIFIAQPDYLSHFHNRGYTHTYWLPLACDPAVHRVRGLPRDIDVGFIGSFGGAGTRRNALLTTVLSRFTTNDVRRFYSPIEMGQIYSRSRIVFNASINGDVNMRVFEAMAAGALLITDRINNGLAELFVEAQHYVGYSCAQEGMEKIAHYLESRAERERIAQAGQAVVLAKHTYSHRWAHVVATAGKAIENVGSSTLALSPKQRVLVYARIFEARRDPIGLIQLMTKNTPSLRVGIHLLRAIGRAINARVPITPNAIRARGVGAVNSFVKNIRDRKEP
jgi:hypothetical protein